MPIYIRSTFKNALHIYIQNMYSFSWFNKYFNINKNIFLTYYHTNTFLLLQIWYALENLYTQQITGQHYYYIFLT